MTANKAIASIVYGIGAILTLALACLFLSHSSFVPSPDTMLPAALYELATIWLSLGALPMLLACVWMKRACQVRGLRVALIFVPAAICLAALIFWVAVMGIGMAR